MQIVSSIFLMVAGESNFIKPDQIPLTYSAHITSLSVLDLVHSMVFNGSQTQFTHTYVGRMGLKRYYPSINLANYSPAHYRQNFHFLYRTNAGKSS